MALVVMIVLAVFDGAFYFAFMANYVGKPLRGLGALLGSGTWTTSDALFDIAVQNVATAGAILLTIWVARRISRGRSGPIVYVAVALIVVLVLVTLLSMPFMLHVIMGDRPPNG